MSISVACPWTPPNGWWIMIRAWGSPNRLPRALAAGRLLHDHRNQSHRASPCHVSTLRRYGRVLDKEIERLLLPEPEPQPLEVTALLHHATDRRRRPLAPRRDRLDLALDLGVARGEALRLRDRVEHQQPAYRPLRAGPELRGELVVIPAHAVGVHPLPPHPL